MTDLGTPPVTLGLTVVIDGTNWSAVPRMIHRGLARQTSLCVASCMQRLASESWEVLLDWPGAAHMEQTGVHAVRSSRDPSCQSHHRCMAVWCWGPCACCRFLDGAYAACRIECKVLSMLVGLSQGL